MSLADRLRKIVSPQFVIEDEETRRPFECDGLTLYRELPDLVVLPGTRDEVVAVVRQCAQAGVAVVPRGAGTGLCAGATPSPGAVVVGLSRLDAIIDIDPHARTARVQPGVRNLAISEAAAEHGLFYGPDPSSQIACSIGGNIAENSGGVHCLKYGLTVHNVLSIEFIDANGRIMTLGGDALDSAGYDLLALAIGSEGLLGIVTEITVRLLPAPEAAYVVLAAFDSAEAAGNAVGAVIAAGIIPAALEMMDALAIQAAEDFAHAGYPRDAAAILLCEIDGSSSETQAGCNKVTAIFEACGATLVRVATSAEEKALFWKGRKSAFPAVGRIAADYYCMDGTIPRSRIAYVLTQISAMAADAGLRVANVFHAGDGNLHPLILYDASRPGDTEKADELGGRILELCVEVGGCITGEHGVGLEKIRQMPAQFSDAEVTQFHAIRRAFDPNERLNPGKAIPQLRYCQEYRSLRATSDE